MEHTMIQLKYKSKYKHKYLHVNSGKINSSCLAPLESDLGAAGIIVPQTQ